ncbi:MAG: hypothetical protein ACYCPN_05805 [Thermoplasmata archaeon]
MEYVILRAVHPSRLITQLPREVAELMGFPVGGTLGRTDSRSISFLGRGDGLVRVVATYPVREAIALESIRGRLLGSAQFGEKFIFSLPTTVLGHLGVQVRSAEGRPGRVTADSLLWFLPSPEYYQYRGATADGGAWAGPLGEADLAHIYLARSHLPLPKDISDLYERDRDIESQEWAPSLRALRRIGAGRTAAAPARGIGGRTPPHPAAR